MKIVERQTLRVQKRLLMSELWKLPLNVNYFIIMCQVTTKICFSQSPKTGEHFTYLDHHQRTSWDLIFMVISLLLTFLEIIKKISPYDPRVWRLPLRGSGSLLSSRGWHIFVKFSMVTDRFRGLEPRPFVNRSPWIFTFGFCVDYVCRHNKTFKSPRKHPKPQRRISCLFKQRKGDVP